MSVNRVRNVCEIAGALLALCLPVLATGFAPAPTEDASLNAYLNATPANRITRLQADLDAGRVHLSYDRRRGYLPSLLKALDIPVSSQTLVFSRTSFQHDRISPLNPRALYFNDEVYVGWVPGGDILEISTADPRLGAVFYTLPQSPDVRPRLIRPRMDCVQCHRGAMTKNVAGHIMRSVYTMRDGLPDLGSGTYLTSDASPMWERWGGWYVTGNHGTMRHMGNGFLNGPAGSAGMDRDSGANVTDLSAYFDTGSYLTSGSDIVALLVLQHQVNVHTLVTQVDEQTRRVLSEEAVRPLSEGARGRIRDACEPLVRALLFADEPTWDSPVRGLSSFTTDFASRGPRDHEGRSLHQFDLKYRLFRYPCSFLIYSPAFDALPAEAKGYVYGRLAEVLSGKETGKGFDRLTAAQREGIRTILCETKPEFARVWAGSAAPGGAR